MTTSKRERFSRFIKDLQDAPPADNAPAALKLLADTLNAVEDRFSGIPARSDLWQNDGRMYPPQEDNRRPVEMFPGQRRYRSKGHNTWIEDNGAIRITLLDGTIVFDKPGADGRKVRS